MGEDRRPSPLPLKHDSKSRQTIARRGRNLEENRQDVGHPSPTTRTNNQRQRPREKAPARKWTTCHGCPGLQKHNPPNPGPTCVLIAADRSGQALANQIRLLPFAPTLANQNQTCLFNSSPDRLQTGFGSIRPSGASEAKPNIEARHRTTSEETTGDVPGGSSHASRVRAEKMAS
jgi:hypothetical protein